jgi:hypothetical protein
MTTVPRIISKFLFKLNERDLSSLLSANSQSNWNNQTKYPENTKTGKYAKKKEKLL